MWPLNGQTFSKFYYCNSVYFCFYKRISVIYILLQRQKYWFIYRRLIYGTVVSVVAEAVLTMSSPTSRFVWLISTHNAHNAHIGIVLFDIVFVDFIACS